MINDFRNISARPRAAEGCARAMDPTAANISTGVAHNPHSHSTHTHTHCTVTHTYMQHTLIGTRAREWEWERKSARAESCCPFCLPILQSPSASPSSLLFAAARGAGNVLLWPTSHGFIILTQYTNCPCWRNCWAATSAATSTAAARLVYSLLAVTWQGKGDSAVGQTERKEGRNKKEWIEQKASECTQNEQSRENRELREKERGL